MHLYLVALAVLALDQVTKFLIRKILTPGQSIPLISNFFDLTYILNPGAAFGILAGSSPSFRNPFFIAVSILAILLIVCYHHRHGEERLFPAFGLGLILGGALGNLLDRLRFGMVVDFLDLHIGRYHWPAFNMADAAITIGVGLMLLDMLKERRRKGGVGGGE